MNETNATEPTTQLSAPGDRVETPESATEEAANDVTSAPEEASDSEIPNDPRPPHALQPPTKEEY
jgi:hypothetical protein